MRAILDEVVRPAERIKLGTRFANWWKNMADLIWTSNGIRRLHAIRISGARVGLLMSIRGVPNDPAGHQCAFGAYQLLDNHSLRLVRLPVADTLFLSAISLSELTDWSSHHAAGPAEQSLSSCSRRSWCRILRDGYSVERGGSSAYATIIVRVAERPGHRTIRWKIAGDCGGARVCVATRDVGAFPGAGVGW